MMRMDSYIGKRNWDDLRVRIEKETIIIMLVGLILARASIFKDLTPFGFAYLSAYIISKGLSIPLIFSISIGTLSFQGTKGISYILAYILVHIFFSKIKDEKNFSLIKASIVTSIIFLTCKILGLLLGTIFIYDIFMALFETIVVFTFSYIFSFSIPIEKIRGTNISNEKTICTFITLALMLSGMGELALFEVKIKNMASIITILLLSYNQGAFFGGITGIVLGMISYISHSEMPFIISILAVAGLLSGIFKDLGKIGTILGLILGNGIISFYINGLGTSFINYREILLGSIIFLITSKKVNEKISEIFSANYYLKKNYNQKRDELVAKKLNRMADLFENLSITFKETAEEREPYSTGEIYSIVDNIANDVCIKCSEHSRCWSRNYYSTYHNFFNIVGLVEMKGVNNEKVHSEIDKFCIRKVEILDKVDRAVDMLKLNERWKQKLKDHRLLLSEQLEGFSSVIENISTEIYENPSFNEEMEQNIYKELKNKRIDVSEVTVAQIGEDNYDIFVDLNTPVKSDNKINAIISQVLEAPVVSENNLENINKKKLRFKLIRHNRYSAVTKVALSASSENNISGDSYTFGEMENLYFSAISDGMGVGSKANKESKVAISLLERLMEANIDKNLTLKTINSVLRAKSSGEIFTTLDLSFIDLYTGKLQIIKTGAPATFIKKKDRVEIINSSSLPVGMLKEVDFNIYEEYIEDGDIIIMMSDGILDSCPDIRNRELWMKDIIMSLDSINPQVIANRILNIAKNNDKSNRDDMTVLVTKVWKNI